MVERVIDLNHLAGLVFHAKLRGSQGSGVAKHMLQSTDQYELFDGASLYHSLQESRVIMPFHVFPQSSAEEHCPFLHVV